LLNTAIKEICCCLNAAKNTVANADMPHTRTSGRKSTGGRSKQTGETAEKRKETEQEREDRLIREAQNEEDALQLTYIIVHLRNFTWPIEWRHLDLTNRLDMLHQRIVCRVHAYMDILHSNTISKFERHRSVWAIVSGTDLSTWHTSSITITLCLQYVGGKDQSPFCQLQLSDAHWQRWAARMDTSLLGANFAASLTESFNFRNGVLHAEPDVKVQWIMSVHFVDMRIHSIRRPVNWREEDCWKMYD
jgi:hypothetical protein